MTIEEYINGQEPEIQPKLRQIYDMLKEVLPDAAEKFSYGMPTFWQGRNLIHFAVQKKHIGLYPGPEAIVIYQKELDEQHLTYSKGAIQIPYTMEPPMDLIRMIAEFCLKQYAK